MMFKRGDKVKVVFAVGALTCKAHEKYVGHVGVVSSINEEHSNEVTYISIFDGKKHTRPNPEGPIRVQFDHWIEDEDGKGWSQAGSFYSWQLSDPISHNNDVIGVGGHRWSW